MHVDLGGYHVRDVKVVAAFDVDANKVGKDVAEAIFTAPNNTIRFSDVPPLGVTVSRGWTLDGLGAYYRETVVESPEPEVDVVQVLKDTQTDVLVSYLPVGSEEADRFYETGSRRAHRDLGARAAPDPSARSRPRGPARTCRTASAADRASRS